MKYCSTQLFIMYFLSSRCIDANLKALINTNCFSKIKINLDEPCQDLKLVKKCQYSTCVVPRADFSDEKDICKSGVPNKNRCVYINNSDKDAIGVNLRTADQVYSGYKDGASNIWRNIYKAADGYPLITKLVSGIHFSITVHIAVYYKYVSHEYLSNPVLYHQKFRPEYYDNLKLALNFVRCAVGNLNRKLYKCSLQLSSHEMDLIKKVIKKARKHSSINVNVKGYGNVFKKILRLVNCIECDKCKLWGKIQFHGLKTAMNVILKDKKFLTGNELVYIMQLLYKLESSLSFAKKLREKY